MAQSHTKGATGDTPAVSVHYYISPVEKRETSQHVHYYISPVEKRETSQHVHYLLPELQKTEDNELNKKIEIMGWIKTCHLTSGRQINK